MINQHNQWLCLFETPLRCCLMMRTSTTWAVSRMRWCISMHLGIFFRAIETAKFVIIYLGVANASNSSQFGKNWLQVLWTSWIIFIRPTFWTELAEKADFFLMGEVDCTLNPTVYHNWVMLFLLNLFCRSPKIWKFRLIPPFSCNLFVNVVIQFS